MPHFLAIDAGGTSTRCLLADDTRILARASTGSIKLQRVSQHEATLRLTMMLAELAIAARVPLNQITRTCIGLAGVTIPSVRAWAERTLSATVSGSPLILGDEEIALDAAFPNAPGPGSPAASGRWGGGILLIAGTGSNCIARSPTGTLHRAGGHGPVLGDQGGGYWIGLETLRAALQALDRENPCHSERSEESTSAPPNPCHSERSEESTSAPPNPCHSERSEESPHFPNPATQLLTSIQHHFRLATLPELIELGNRRTEPLPDFASLAPLIARAAAAGNPIASSTLTRAAAELAALVTLVAGKLGMPRAPLMTHPSSSVGSAHSAAPPRPSPRSQCPPPEIPIAFTGSILTEIPAVHAALAARLAEILPTARLHPTPVDPLLGALHRARRP